MIPYPIFPFILLYDKHPSRTMLQSTTGTLIFDKPVCRLPMCQHFHLYVTLKSTLYSKVCYIRLFKSTLYSRVCYTRLFIGQILMYPFCRRFASAHCKNDRCSACYSIPACKYARFRSLPVFLLCDNALPAVDIQPICCR